MPRWLRWIARLAAWVALSSLLLVASGAIGLIWWARSPSGRQRLLAVLVDFAGRRLTGTLSIARLEGDLTRELVLRDVRVLDAEGELVVRVDRLRARYDLLALVRRRLRFSEVGVEGAEVHARLRSRALNLATLVKPRESPPSERTRSILVERLTGEVALRYDGAEGSEPWRATVRADGGVELAGGAIDARLRSLTLESTTPLRGRAEAHGGARFEAGALASVNLSVGAHVDGGELDALAPAAKPQGAVDAELRAEGAVRTGVEVRVRVRPERGELRVDGRASRAASGGLAWQATAHMREIDPAKIFAGAPRARIELAASGRGAGAAGRIDVERLEIEAPGTRGRAHGVVTLGGGMPELDATVEVRSRDLSRLSWPGRRALAGRLDAHAHVVRGAAPLRIDARVHAQGLKVAAAKIARLEAAVHTVGLDGTATLRARGVGLPGDVALDRVELDAAGDPHRFTVELDANGPEGATAVLRARGAPLAGGGGVSARSLDLSIDELTVGARGQRWRLTRPARLRAGDEDVTASLALADDGDQRLNGSARWARAGDALAVELTGRALDAQKIARVLRPSLDAPATRLDLDARVTGARAHPSFDAKLRGRALAWPERDLPEIAVTLEARSANGRVRAALQARSSGARVDAHADAPLSLDGDRPLSLDGDRPLSAELTATGVELAHLRSWLPPGLGTLAGRARVTAGVRGTSRDPELHARLEADDWTLAELAHNQASLALDYRGRQLDARLDAQLETRLSPPSTLAVRAHAPIDLPAALRARRFSERLDPAAPIALTIRAERLDLGRLPLDRLGVRTPFTGGRVDASVDVRGTLRAPIADARLEARELATAEPEVDQLDVELVAGYQARRAHAALNARLRGAPILNARAGLDLDLATAAARRWWRDAAIAVDATIPSYDLSRVESLSGELAGSARLRGTVARPIGEATLRAGRLALFETRFSHLEARASLDGEALVAKLDAAQAPSGAARLEARLPRSADAALAIHLRSDRLKLALSDLGALRKLEGTLDGELSVSGTRARPQMNGSLKLAKGALSLAEDPREYRDVTISVRAQHDTIELERLHSNVGSGSLVAGGTLTLDGLRAIRVDAYAEANRLPFAKDNVRAWLDARAELHGHRQGDKMTGELTITRGSAELPKLAGTRRLQSLDPLEDVVFTDGRAERARKASSLSAQVIARVPGPFRVRSPELRTDLNGEVEARLATGAVELFGQVEAQGGHVELLGRRYQIERARVGFHGAPDPELDVRVTRAVHGATIAIEVHGTADQPRIELASDPPVYDSSQILGMIVSGDPGDRHLDARSTEQQLVGALSGVLVGKLEEQLLPGLPFDVIRVGRHDGAGAFSSQGTTRVEVGKHLGDRLYVSYVHQLGTPTGLERVNSNEATIEYRLGRRFQVAARFGDEGIGGLEFDWAIRF